MLNLKKLADKLDQTLEKETVESLSLWLTEKRKKANYYNNVEADIPYLLDVIVMELEIEDELELLYTSNQPISDISNQLAA